MFNGIIFHTGIIKFIKRGKKNILIGIKSKLKIKKGDIGSSISCDGVCLTLSNVKSDLIFFYVSKQFY